MLSDIEEAEEAEDLNLQLENMMMTKYCFSPDESTKTFKTAQSSTTGSNLSDESSQSLLVSPAPQELSPAPNIKDARLQAKSVLWKCDQRHEKKPLTEQVIEIDSGDDEASGITASESQVAETALLLNSKSPPQPKPKNFREFDAMLTKQYEQFMQEKLGVDIKTERTVAEIKEVVLSQSIGIDKLLQGDEKRDDMHEKVTAIYESSKGAKASARMRRKLQEANQMLKEKDQMLKEKDQKIKQLERALKENNRAQPSSNAVATDKKNRKQSWKFH